MEAQHISPSPLQDLLALQTNTHCLHCGHESKQWADLTHAIFLCLNCAAAFRQLSELTQIKSTHLDKWSPEEVERLKRGGNERFSKFLKQYDLDLAEIRTVVTCRASAYYRALLDGKAEGEQPTHEEGKMISKEHIVEEFKHAVKEKEEANSKTQQLGHHEAHKAQEKVEAGELHEGDKKIESPSKGKKLWGVVRGKVGQIASEHKK